MAQFNNNYNQNFNNQGNFNTFNNNAYNNNNQPPSAGYMVEQQQIQQPQQPNKPKTITPCTILQIYRGTPTGPDEKEVLIDGNVVNQISCIGQIMEHNFSSGSSHVSVLVDDGTSRITAKVWSNESEEQEDDWISKTSQELGIGKYVFIVGTVKNFKGKKSINASSITPLDDYNRITYHFLEAIYVHLYNKQGPLPEFLDNSVVGGSSGSNNNNGNNMNNQNYNPNASIEDQIYMMIKSCNSADGMHISQIANQLNLNIEQVNGICQQLCGTASIYTTKNGYFHDCSG
eukprot:TRINITY_DN1855_c0_g1_i1.p1 TRINITY_DN1855_c0_g1~~TRINITY_DN1855_c0_g1_i1.p1  ORF type:complete len:288 (+),score=92.77 TRINITY_DN1855_c0_g1_i1:194-1057(+)